MRISRSTSETSAYVLTTQVVQDVHRRMHEKLPYVKLTVSCADRLERTFDSIEEFQGYQNAKRSAIEELIISSRDQHYANQCTLAFNKGRTRNIRLSIDADEEIAIALNDALSEMTDAIRPWYSWIARADWYIVVFMGWVLTQLGQIVVLIIKHGAPDFSKMPKTLSFEDFLRGASSGFLPILIGVVLNIARDRFFPMSTFALGDGASRHARSEIIRSVLIVALAISIVSSIMVSWFV